MSFLQSTSKVILVGVTAGIVLVALLALLYIAPPITGNAVSSLPVREQTGLSFGEEGLPKMVVFFDYQCPYCRKFATDTLPKIKRNYVDAGRIQLVMKDTLLTSFHPGALNAAQAARCVYAQGGEKAYWSYMDLIMREQNLRDSGSPNKVTRTVDLSNQDLILWAGELGYTIRPCIASQAFKSAVEQDTQDAQAYGVQGTPSFIINDNLVLGDQPYEVFSQALNQALCSKNVCP